MLTNDVVSIEQLGPDLRLYFFALVTIISKEILGNGSVCISTHDVFVGRK